MKNEEDKTNVENGTKSKKGEKYKRDDDVLMNSSYWKWKMSDGLS